MRKQVYLLGAIVGTVIPGYFLIQFVIHNGLDLQLFVEQLFASPAAAMFAADLLITSFVFWVFLYSEGRKRNMGNLWLYVILNLFVGLSLAFPLFLYFREKGLDAETAPAPAQAG